MTIFAKAQEESVQRIILKEMVLERFNQMICGCLSNNKWCGSIPLVQGKHWSIHQC